MIAGLLLAAGRSRRFGSDKLLAPLGGRPVIRWSAEALAEAVDVLYLVAPPGAPELVRALDGIQVVVVEHPGRDQGIGTSIAAGIGAMGPDVEAALIALADQPLMDGAVARRLGERWRADGEQARAVAPSYRDGRGHPVLFARSCFADLEALQGDSGARALLDAMGEALALVPVDADAPRDVDTPAMLELLERERPR